MHAASQAAIPGNPRGGALSLKGKHLYRITPASSSTMFDRGHAGAKAMQMGVQKER